MTPWTTLCQAHLSPTPKVCLHSWSSCCFHFPWLWNSSKETSGTGTDPKNESTRLEVGLIFFFYFSTKDSRGSEWFLSPTFVIMPIPQQRALPLQLPRPFLQMPLNYVTQTRTQCHQTGGNSVPHRPLSWSCCFSRTASASWYVERFSAEVAVGKQFFWAWDRRKECVSYSELLIPKLQHHRDVAGWTVIQESLCRSF